MIYLLDFGCPGYGRYLKIVILLYYGFIDTALSAGGMVYRFSALISPCCICPMFSRSFSSGQSHHFRSDHRIVAQSIPRILSNGNSTHSTFPMRFSLGRLPFCRLSLESFR